MSTPLISAAHATHLAEWTETILLGDTPTAEACLVLHGTAPGADEALQDVRRALETQGGCWLEASSDAKSDQSPLVAIVQEALRFLEAAQKPTRMATALTAFGWTSAREIPRRLAGVMDAETHRNQVEALRALFSDLAAAGPAVVRITHAERLDDDCVALLEKLLQSSNRNPDIHPIGRMKAAFPTLLLSMQCEPTQLPGWVPSFIAATGIRTLGLAGMTRQHVRNWLATDAVVDRISQLTGGVTARMEALLEALPEDLEALAERRLSTLPPHARDVGQLLNTSRGPLNAPLLAQLLGEDPRVVEHTLGALKISGLVETDDEGLWRLTAGDHAVLSARSMGEACAHSTLAAHHEALWRREQHSADVLEAAHHHLESGAADIASDLLLEASEILLGRLQFHGAHRFLSLLLDQSLTTDLARRAWILRSAVANGLGRSEEAATALEHARDLDPNPKLDAAVELATLFAHAGRPEDASRILAPHGLPEQRSAPSDVAAAGLLILAEIARQRGQLEEARALASLASAQRPVDAALTEGSAWFREGALAEASAAYERASNNATGQQAVRARHNLALIALREGRPLDASRMLQENLSLCEAEGEWFGVAIAQLNLGVAYEELERFALAEQFHVQAIELFERLERPLNLIGALSSLGDLALHLGEIRRSRRLLERARELAGTEAAAYERAWATMRLAAVDIERKRLGHADTAIREAETWFQDHEHHGDWTRSVLVRVQLVLARGNASAAAELLESLDTSGPGGGPRIALDALLLEAETLMALEEPGRALLLASDAMDAASEIGLREPLVRAHLIAGVATLAEDDREAAKAHCERASELLDALKNDVPLAKRERFLRRSVFRSFAPLRAALTESPALPEETPPVRQEMNRPQALQKLLGTSPALEKTIQHAERFASLDAPVLIRGESGTGKELLAEALHQLSPRRRGPFLRVNAAALSDSLLESELFGHERGAFTGADRQRKGNFEAAHGGVLFLDEIGDISPRAQKTLLRVLETGRFHRVGGTREISVDVRVLCATHRNLEEAVTRGEFRLDLYHRISGLTLTMAPLRERTEDIGVLASHFLADLNATHERSVQFSPSALRALSRNAWPGNVRELQHAIQRAFHLSDGNVLEASGVLPQGGSTSPIRSDDAARSPAPALGETGLSLDDAKRDLEIHLIREALERTDGNITQAAKLLQMSRPRLSQKSREYGIRSPGKSAEEKS